MLQYKSFSRIFRIFYTPKVHHVIPYFLPGKKSSVMRSLAERVLVLCHFLTVTLFSGLLKTKTMPRSRRS